MIKSLFKSSIAKILLVLYVALLLFWLGINLNGWREGPINNLYGALYPMLSVIGGVYGLVVIAKRWGGLNSVIGRAIFFLSLGLLGEAFGQWAWSYFVIIKGVEVPYPSIADLGYFSIIPFYGYAMYNLARASGVRISLKSFSGKLQALLIPTLMIVIAYSLFLRNVAVDFTNPIKTFLDFVYPGLEPIAVSIGILTFSITRDVLGGRMKAKVLFLISALVIQYVADYSFLYTAGVGSYNNAGFVDLMYTTALFIMSLGILNFREDV